MLNSWFIAFFSVAVGLLATRIVSTTIFYASQWSKRPREPPVAPYWIPWLCHAIAMAISPSKCFHKMMNRYLHRAPFMIKAGPHRFVVLHDPRHIKRVFQSKATELTNQSFHVQIFEKVLATPPEAVKYYAADQSQFPAEQRVGYVHKTVPQKYLQRAHLDALSKQFVTLLRRNLESLDLGRDWFELPDLYSFLQTQVTHATIETLMGSVLLQHYPDISADFWLFDQHLEDFMNVPKFMMRSAYGARDRLLTHLVEWDRMLVKKLESPEDDDKEWTIWGSKFIRLRHKAFLNMPTVDENARASEILGSLQAANSNTYPFAFWYIFEALRDSALQAKLQGELDSCTDPASGNIDLMKITMSPLMLSMHAEVSRLRLAAASAVTLEGDSFPLDEQYYLTKGTAIMLMNHHLSLDQELWTNARPDAVKVPLEAFWAERFLKSEGKYSVEGISNLWFPWGGGQHMCPGRHMARNIAIGTFAVLFEGYDCELVDLEKAEDVIPPLRGLAYGILRPKGKVTARLRRKSAKT